tara:strand:- start:97 stop:438 length:342 start_codon:yes stop_codon:yes gene_type:complete
MKKLTLSIGLLTGILTSNAQDTTCFLFKDSLVYIFDNKNKLKNTKKFKEQFYTIKANKNNILGVDLYDEKVCVRLITVIYKDNSHKTFLSDSFDKTYYFDPKVLQVKVSLPIE